MEVTHALKKLVKSTLMILWLKLLTVLKFKFTLGDKK